MTKPNLRAILAIVLVSYLMGVLDVSIVITALPKIQRDFGASPTQLTWVQNAYTLAFGGFLLLGARAGDFFGRRRIFMVGMSIFTVASVLIAASTTLPAMLAARVLQGLGAAILTPTTLALLSTYFPQGPERNRAVSYYGAMAGIGTSVGLVLGGILADSLSWRVGFFVNLPIGIMMMLLARRHVQETTPIRGRVDIFGAILSTFGATSLVFGTESAASEGWLSPRVLVAMPLGLILLISFILHERRVANPILPLRLLKHRARLGGYAARGLFVGGMMGFWFFMSVFLQQTMGLSAFQTGIAFLPTTLVGFGSSFVASRLTQRFGNGKVAAAGLVGALTGMTWLSFQVSNAASIALPLMLIGLGQGLSLGPLTGAGMVDVAPEDAGAGSGLINVAQQMGGSFGLSILAVVFAGSTGDLGHRVSMTLTGSAMFLATALTIVALFVIRGTSRSLSTRSLTVTVEGQRIKVA